MNKLAVIIAIIISVAAPVSGLAQQRTLEEIVARVNNEIILKSELDRALTELRMGLAEEEGLQGAQLEQAYNQRSKDMLRDLIDQSLLMQVAAERGLTADVEVVRTMDRLRQENNLATMEELEKAIESSGFEVEDFKQGIRTRYLTQTVIGQEVSSRIIVTVEDLRTFYEANKSRFDRPAGVRLGEIVVFTENVPPAELPARRKKIDDALASIRSGTDFAEVARTQSESASAPDGGALGFMQQETLDEQLSAEVAKLERGQTSEVITRPYGFLILNVEDKHSGGVLSFENAQDEIQNELFQQRLTPKVREYLAKLRTEGSVRVSPGYTDTGAVTPPVPTAQR